MRGRAFRDCAGRLDDSRWPHDLRPRQIYLSCQAAPRPITTDQYPPLFLKHLRLLSNAESIPVIAISGKRFLIFWSVISCAIDSENLELTSDFRSRNQIYPSISPLPKFELSSHSQNGQSG